MPSKIQNLYHHNDLRRSLIDGAIALMQEVEINQLSLREICRRIGVSHNAPYRHFADKDELLTAVAEEGFLILRDTIEAEIGKAPYNPLKELQDIGIAYIQFALEHPSQYRLMFGKYRKTLDLKPPDLAKAPGEVLAVLVDAAVQQEGSEKVALNAQAQALMVLINVVIRGQQAGVFREDDPKQLALAAWSLVHGFAMLLIDGMIFENVPQPITLLSAVITQFLVDGFAISKNAHR
jgi:AcrR family transcriptional regulator